MFLMVIENCFVSHEPRRDATSNIVEKASEYITNVQEGDATMLPVVPLPGQ